jgi:arginine decarboxylase
MDRRTQGSDLYSVAHWGAGYFDVSADGHVLVRPSGRVDGKPDGDPVGPSIDLFGLAKQVEAQGLRLPILLRFSGIIRDRVKRLCEAFDWAIEHQEYAGKYTVIYPIKVNQQRTVVEQVVAGAHGRGGLESGSKTELLAVLGVAPPGSVIVCNGYKDREYMELAMIGERLGHRVYVVIEKLNELGLLLKVAEAIGVTPRIGIRLRLGSMGAGKWQDTGGPKSKFGLSADQLITAIDQLREHDSLERLELLHVHFGSQIANLRDIQNAMREVAQLLAQFSELGAKIKVMDVGGGLGVDYEGTQSRSACSTNYGLDQYAMAIVRAIQRACAEVGCPEPDIFSESGRALSAHHAVLITEVIGIDSPNETIPDQPSEDADEVLVELWDLLQRSDDDPVLECYQDLLYWQGETLDQFVKSSLTLVERARADRIMAATARKLHGRMNRSVRAHHHALLDLESRLADKLFCNLSVFQSMPDVWAIDQVFPILPLQRLTEVPTRRGIVHDLTCDSDGRIEQYVDRFGVEPTMPIHTISDDERYWLGFFMVGAYQEILGDLHNLYGDTDSADVEVLPDGSAAITHQRQGDTADTILKHVDYDAASLQAAFEPRLLAAELEVEEREHFREVLSHGLSGYTYLEE